MFTGIIEEIGNIKKIDSISGGFKIIISASKVLEDLKINNSIAVNGVCLTVISINNKNFNVEAVGETLKKTTLKEIRINQLVNLERAIKITDRLGGHLVQGHVNGVGKIIKVQKLGENYLLEVEIPINLIKYIIDEGSITIDGISLTIAKIVHNKIAISIIPHTWKNTNLSTRKIGAKVNIETDLIAKYIENLILNIKDDRAK
ncbi:MAG: riboflavin synthase [Ignavibacteriales bacterium CG_4_9_14_3_um_filter_30_11]|nr:MAG: riboflavin synthase [Ignavibacteriales bacterium CG_4_9_14_3_um_filter_30_11]